MLQRRGFVVLLHAATLSFRNCFNKKKSQLIRKMLTLLPFLLVLGFRRTSSTAKAYKNVGFSSSLLFLFQTRATKLEKQADEIAFIFYRSYGFEVKTRPDQTRPNQTKPAQSKIQQAVIHSFFPFSLSLSSHFLNISLFTYKHKKSKYSKYSHSAS